MPQAAGTSQSPDASGGRDGRAASASARQERLIADVRPVIWGKPPAAIRVLIQPGGHARPIARRDRGEKPVAPGVRFGDEIEAVADIEALDAAGTQEILVGDDDDASGAEPRPQPALELQAGRIVQDDGVGVHHRRLRREGQAYLGEGLRNRRIDGPVPQHRDRQAEDRQADMRREGTDLGGRSAGGPAGGPRVDQQRHPWGRSSGGRLDTVIEFVHFASHFCLRRRRLSPCRTSV